MCPAIILMLKPGTKVILLGGRAFERYEVGALTNGSSDLIKEATQGSVITSS